MSHAMLTPTLASLILYGQGGMAGVEEEGSVMAGAVFGLIGILGGNKVTKFR